MFCGKCGAKNPDGAAFCGNCGAPLVQTAPEQRDAAPVQNAAAQPPSAGKAKKRRPIGVFTVVIVVVALIFFGKNSSGEDTPPAAGDSPTAPVQDTSTPEGDSQKGSTEDSQEDDAAGSNESDPDSGQESNAAPSGLTGTADSSGYITVELTDMGQYNAVALNDNDWDILADLAKNVTYVYNGVTYYLGTDRLAPTDVDADGNLIMQIPNHWLHIGGMKPYIQYIGDYVQAQGEYVAYAMVNGNGAFLSVITDWSSYINIQGYYIGDLSSGEYGDALYKFNSSDEIVLVMMTDTGLWGSEPYAAGDLSVEYKAINTENLSELSVRYTMTDINGQRYRTPYVTWK